MESAGRRRRGQCAAERRTLDGAAIRNLYVRPASTKSVDGGNGGGAGDGGGGGAPPAAERPDGAARAGDTAGAASGSDTAPPAPAVMHLDPDAVRRFVPARKQDSYKGQNGRVLVVGGSYMYHGAPILASLAALRSGSDLVYVAVPSVNVQATRTASPDLIVVPMADQKLTRGSVRKLLGQVPAGLHSAAIGMGLAVQDRNALSLLATSLLNADVRLALDGGALLPEVMPAVSGSPCVVTPHSGEFRRLFGERPPPAGAERIAAVARAARRHRVTILLKGPSDIVSDGERTFLSSGGGPSMTVGGTGDVLAGLLAGLLARNRDPVEAAAAAAFFNGQAGKSVQKGMGLHMAASDLVAKLPSVMRPFDATGPGA